MGMKEGRKFKTPVSALKKRPKKDARDISKEPEMIRLKELAKQMNEAEKARTLEYLNQDDNHDTQ
ncbi:MAG: hypothetical protein HQK99_16780 [Nitrospirae bacterium]|nr:hypothetical protein [Nitrospirota bacterium]